MSLKFHMITYQEPRLGGGTSPRMMFMTKCHGFYGIVLIRRDALLSVFTEAYFGDSKIHFLGSSQRYLSTQSLEFVDRVSPEQAAEYFVKRQLDGALFGFEDANMKIRELADHEKIGRAHV